jgi:hypothetical protein
MADVARFLFTIEIPMGWTNTEGGCEGEIWEPKITNDLLDKAFDRLNVLDFFPKVDMEDRPPGVFCLQIILEHEGLENIIGIIYRKL